MPNNSQMQSAHWCIPSSQQLLQYWNDGTEHKSHCDKCCSALQDTWQSTFLTFVDWGSCTWDHDGKVHHLAYSHSLHIHPHEAAQSTASDDQSNATRRQAISAPLASKWHFQWQIWAGWICIFVLLPWLSWHQWRSHWKFFFYIS